LGARVHLAPGCEPAPSYAAKCDPRVRFPRPQATAFVQRDLVALFRGKSAREHPSRVGAADHVLANDPLGFTVLLYWFFLRSHLSTSFSSPVLSGEFLARIHPAPPSLLVRLTLVDRDRPDGGGADA